MRKRAFICTMVLALMAGGVPSFAEDAEAVLGRFQLGPTGIYCIKAPCPWYGIVRVDEQGQPEGEPLWTGDTLPEIDAEPDVRDRVLAIRQAAGCVIVEGELSKARLAISRVLGAC